MQVLLRTPSSNAVGMPKYVLNDTFSQISRLQVEQRLAQVSVGTPFFFLLAGSRTQCN